MDTLINKYLWPHNRSWGTRSGSIGDPILGEQGEPIVGEGGDTVMGEGMGDV